MPCRTSRDLGLGSLGFGLELAIFPLALAKHVQGVARNLESEYFSHHIADALDSRITELEQMIAVLADEMVVLPEAGAVLSAATLVVVDGLVTDVAAAGLASGSINTTSSTE